MRSTTLIVLALALATLAASPAHAGWYAANTGSFFAFTGSPVVPGPGIDVVVQPSTRLTPPHTAQCTYADASGSLAASTGGNGVHIADVLLHGTSCAEATTPVTFACTSGELRAIVFQALGGSSPTWLGSKSQGILQSMACSYTVGGCTVTATGSAGLNWFNESVTGVDGLIVLAGPGSQSLSYANLWPSAACTAQRLNGLGTLTIVGTSTVPSAGSTELHVTTGFPGSRPRIWEQ